VLEIVPISNRVYEGEPIERGGTSIKGQGAAPPARWLWGRYIRPGMKVLDYGAGKYGRNAIHFREKGAHVYAYDPFNGEDTDGWTGVSKTPPTGRFDVAFTCYVLNVLPAPTEDDVIEIVEGFAPCQVHITRNIDILDSVRESVEKGSKVIPRFVAEHYGDVDVATMDRDALFDLCCFGVQTSEKPQRFQRIPLLSRKGFKLVKATNRYKVFHREDGS